MYPRLLPGATVLIDRHFNLPQPYRRNEPNMYAVRRNDTCTIKYVERDGDHLVLRPRNESHPGAALVLNGSQPSELIVGRVCHVAFES